MSEWLEVGWSNFTWSCGVIRVVNAMQLGKEKIIWEMVIRNSTNNGTFVKSRDEIFIRGEGCNTLGVWLPHLHLHFINMSIIHPFMSLDCMKHAFKTLQHMFMFHVCLFYEMNSVQHSSATCATHFSETWLACTMPQTHETWFWNRSNKVTCFPCFNTCDAWFWVTNVWCG